MHSFYVSAGDLNSGPHAYTLELISLLLPFVVLEIELHTCQARALTLRALSPIPILFNHLEFCRIFVEKTTSSKIAFIRIFIII